MAERIRPELLARFGNDPDALEWARGVIQQSVDLLEAAIAMPGATPEMRNIGGFTVKWMREQFIGTPGRPGIDPGASLGRFDARCANPAQEDAGG